MNYQQCARVRAHRERASFHTRLVKRDLFLDISHPLDRRKELKMVLIAVGSRPETPDVTKFFELPVVDRRFREGRVKGLPYIRNSYLRWGLRWVGKPRFLKCDQYEFILTNSDAQPREKKKEEILNTKIACLIDK